MKTISEMTQLLGFEETINKDVYQQRIIDAAKKQWNDSYFGKSEKKLVKFTLRKLEEYLDKPFVWELADDNGDYTIKAYVYMKYKKCFIIQRNSNIFENLYCLMSGTFDEATDFADLVIMDKSSGWVRRDETDYGWMFDNAILDLPEDHELFFHPNNLQNLARLYIAEGRPMASDYLDLMKHLIGVELGMETFEQYTI